jgi:hypothetical protein
MRYIKKLESSCSFNPWLGVFRSLPFACGSSGEKFARDAQEQRTRAEHHKLQAIPALTTGKEFG